MCELSKKEKSLYLKENPKFLPQLLSAIGVSFGATLVTGWVSFTSVAIPKMIRETTLNQTNEDDPMEMDLHTGSWIASLLSIGNIFGCLIGGFLNQKMGAKKIFLCSAPFAALSWAMVALSHHIWVIFLSRIISGVIFGVFQANGKVYNAEIAHPDFRGSLGAIIGNMASLGSVYMYLTGYLVHSWRTVAWLQLLPVCIFGLSVCFIPDSPYWLVERGRVDDARRSLIRLRGNKYDVETELVEIVNKKKRKEALGKSTLQTLCSRTFILPFLRIGTLIILTQWTGISVLGSYMVTIFIEADSSIDPTLAPIIVCTVQQMFSFLAAFILRVSPRKPLFLLCATGIAISQAGLGTYFYLIMLPGGDTHFEMKNRQEQGYGLIPVLCVVLVYSFRSVGCMAVIQLLVAESFPTEIRSYASGICGVFSSINNFGSTKLFPHFVDSLGFYGTFWMYSCVMCTEVIYGALSIPENKGESLVKTEDKMINDEKDKKDSMDYKETDNNLLGQSSGL